MSSEELTKFSRNLISLEVLMNFSNFKGLEYENESNAAKFEVIATYPINNLKENQMIFTNDVYTEAVFKFEIDTQNDDEINHFLNPLLLTLIKHENDTQSNIGYANIDLYQFFSSRKGKIKFTKKFESEDMRRKISFDVEILTNAPLLEVNYENSIMFTIDSIHNFPDLKNLKVGIRVPFRNEIDKPEIFNINIQDHKTDNYKFKRWLSLFHIFGNASYSNYSNVAYPFDFTCDEKSILNLSISSTKINGIFRSLILTKETEYAFHDHIRKSRKIAIQFLLNSTLNLFGIIDCEELLHVGRTRLRKIIQLYNFDKEIFQKHFQLESVFLVSENAALKKSSRKFSKTMNSGVKFQDSIKALHINGDQIFAIIEIELEKPLIDECVPQTVTSLQEVENYIPNDDMEISSLIECLNYFSNETVHKVISNGSFVTISDRITPYLTSIKDCFFNFNEETFSFYLLSRIFNIKKANQRQNVPHAKIYEAIREMRQAEDIYLHEIIKHEACEDAWLNLAAFYARQGNFDKLLVCINEALQINEKCLIGNIFKAYLLYKTQKFNECTALLKYLVSIYGEIKEIVIMEYLICGTKYNFPKIEITHASIIAIYNEMNYSLNSAHDCTLLSLYDTFINCSIFFIKIGCYDIAELCLGEYYSKYGMNINYLYLLHEIDTVKGSFSNGLVHLQKIAENDVVNYQINYSKIISSLVLNLLHLKNFKKAKELFNTYIQIHSCDNYLILLLFGKHFISTNEFVTAKDFLIKAAKINQLDIVFRELGKCFLKLRMLNLAEKAFMKVLESEMNDVETWINLRELYNIQRRFDAVEFCDKNICI